MISGLWYVLTLAVYTLIYGSWSILAGLFRVKQRPDAIYGYLAYWWGSHLLAAHRLRVRTHGLEKIPDQPCVFVSNHVSFVDIWVLVSLLPRNVRFLAKRELLKVPIFGWAMASAGHIPIDRKKLQKAFEAYDEAAERLKAGTSAIVFGEGTRSRDGKLHALKKGPFVLAIAAGVPIVPIFIAGTYQVLPPGSIRIRRRPIDVYLGEPIVTAGMHYEDREALAERCHAVLRGFSDRVDALPAGD